jgi:peptidoglycan/LPS O-acetylase OafA/YrhL
MLVPLLALIVVGPFTRTALVGQEPWDEYAYLACMDGIAFGCLAALFTTHVRLSAATLRWMMALGMSAILLIVACRGLATDLGLHKVGVGISVLELGVALTLIALSQGTGATLLTRGTGFIRMVGRSSYEIYLTHMLVVLGFMPLIVALKPEASMIYGWYIMLLMLSIALGWTVNKLYSEPLNQALRNSYRMQDR